MNDYILTEASVKWEGSTAYSRDFDDIYWSREAPVPEKTHVFTELIQSSWRQLKPNNPFSIGELGFGFGLNFMLTAERWKQGGFQGFLYYTAYENHPVAPSDLVKLGKFMPQLPIDHLLKHYPLPLYGSHIIWFASNIKLTLIFDDALNALKDSVANMDAWYLDGFSPNKNTDIWNKRVFSQIARLSKPGATLSTFSVSGKVRRDLTNAGFLVTRLAGYGNKREMLFARARGEWIPTERISPKVAIIGSGLAGAYLIEALHRRSLNTVIFDDGKATSFKVPQLAVYPSLAINNEHRYRFSLSAFEYTCLSNPHYHQTGIIFTLKNQRQRNRWLKIAAKFPDYFLDYQDGQIYFPTAGWLASRDLIGQTNAIKQRIEKVSWTGDGWLLQYNGGGEKADAVVLATGAQLPPITVPALIDIIPGLALSVDLKDSPAQVVTGNASIFPPINNVSTISGLYDLNLEKVSQNHIDRLLKDIKTPYTLLTADIGMRATTKDRLPLCGPVPEWCKPNALNPVGLYILQGLGSHGATTARLCAEHIANLITQEVPALGISMQKALNPKRFIQRDT